MVYRSKHRTINRGISNDFETKKCSTLLDIREKSFWGKFCREVQGIHHLNAIEQMEQENKNTKDFKSAIFQHSYPFLLVITCFTWMLTNSTLSKESGNIIWFCSLLQTLKSLWIQRSVTGYYLHMQIQELLWVLHHGRLHIFHCWFPEIQNLNENINKFKA